MTRAQMKAKIADLDKIAGAAAKAAVLGRVFLAFRNDANAPVPKELLEGDPDTAVDMVDAQETTIRDRALAQVAIVKTLAAGL